MGGTVAETIRMKNGEIIKMARKTGAYNWMFFSKEFNNGEVEKAISDHVQKFIEMRDDFLSGEPYQYAMSPVYGWCEETAPVDYGLVVIDFQRKKIHSMQGYDTPATLYSINMSKIMKHDTETEEAYQFLANNNLLEVYDYNGKHYGDVYTVFGAEDTYKQIQSAIESSYNPIKSVFQKLEPTNLIFTPKSLKEFEIILYEEEPTGLLEFLSNLKSDGFNFNSSEIEMWKSHFEDSEHFMPDDDNLSEEEYERLGESNLKEYYQKIDAITMGNI